MMAWKFKLNQKTSYFIRSFHKILRVGFFWVSCNRSCRDCTSSMNCHEEYSYKKKEKKVAWCPLGKEISLQKSWAVGRSVIWLLDATLYRTILSFQVKNPICWWSRLLLSRVVNFPHFSFPAGMRDWIRISRGKCEKRGKCNKWLNLAKNIPESGFKQHFKVFFGWDGPFLTFYTKF